MPQMHEASIIDMYATFKDRLHYVLKDLYNMLFKLLCKYKQNVCIKF